MDELAGLRGRFRLGVVLTALAVLALSIGVAAPIDDIPWWWWVVIGLPGVAGIGLMFHAQLARLLGSLLLAMCGALVPISLVQGLGSAWPLDADPAWWLYAANAIATTLLLTWMCIRGILMMVERHHRASRITVRLAGGVLAVVAAHHLWLASELGFESTGSWSISIAAGGTHLLGFPLWPLWHGALLVVALVMVAGPRRMLGQATAVLMLLFACVVPLVLVGALRTGFFTTAELPMIGMLLVPVYLCWWMRDELQRAEQAA